MLILHEPRNPRFGSVTHNNFRVIALVHGKTLYQRVLENTLGNCTPCFLRSMKDCSIWTMVITRTTGRVTKKWIKHYNSCHRILLVGEGDFSFSACLAKAFGSAENMVATSLDSKEMLVTKHWSSVVHVEELRRLGCLVLHEVDVNDMQENHILKTCKFDRIIFNFPHAGHIGEKDLELIQKHKELLAAFFRSAREIVSIGGEIHVSHRNDYPYVEWKLKKLAKKAGLCLIEMVEFHKADYPGYHNKRGNGIKSNKTFPLVECFTSKFSLEKCSPNESSQTGVSRDLMYYRLEKRLEESLEEGLEERLEEWLEEVFFKQADHPKNTRRSYTKRLEDKSSKDPVK